MLLITTQLIQQRERELVVQYRKLIKLYRPVVAIYEQTKVANATLLMGMYNSQTDEPLADPEVIKWLVSLYSLCEGVLVHDCYVVMDSAFLHFAKTCVDKNLLDLI